MAEPGYQPASSSSIRTPTASGVRQVTHHTDAGALRGDLGGKLEPLVPAGQRFATTDPDVATRLAAEHLQELETRGAGARSAAAALSRHSSAPLRGCS